MFNNEFLIVCPKRFLKAKIKYMPVILLVLVAILKQEANAQNPEDLWLQDTTITTTATFSADNSITAGPNFTIDSTGDVTFESGNFIALIPSLVIISGGQLNALTGVATGIVPTQNPGLPTEFIVHQNYPNPFNPSTTIRYALPQAGYVTLKVFNLLGEQVEGLVSGEQSAGEYEVLWDAGNLASGLYFYRLEAGGYSETKKLLLLK